MVSIHVDNDPENDSKWGRGSNTNWEGPAWTSTKQFANYITVRSIELATSWREQDWPKQCAKELINNAYDFLSDYYPNAAKEARKIALNLKIDSITDDDDRRIILRILVRNSNVDNFTVFEKLEPIFDYSQLYSTKRHQHRIMTGALGDFLKRALGMGYASWTASHNKESLFEDKQWKEPLVLRYNGQEHKVFIAVDGEVPRCCFSEPTNSKAANFTEVEIALPIESTLNDSWKENVKHTLSQIEEYFKRNKIGKTDTDFSFSTKWLIS